MAKCKYCGADISDKATVCPVCRVKDPVDISVPNEFEPEPPKTKTRNSSVLQTANIVHQYQEQQQIIRASRRDISSYLFAFIILGLFAFVAKEFSSYFAVYSFGLGIFLAVVAILLIIPFFIIGIIAFINEKHKLYLWVGIIITVYIIVSCIMIFIDIHTMIKLAEAIIDSNM